MRLSNSGAIRSLVVLLLMTISFFTILESLNLKQRVIINANTLMLLNDFIQIESNFTNRIIPNTDVTDKNEDNIGGEYENQDLGEKLNVTESSGLQITDADFPKWMQEYFLWHVEMRERFPGDELMNHPDAPNLLVRTCLGICGGLNDRLGQLPWDIYVAARTKRVLLIHWARPTPLQDYLIPNRINFTYPDTTWFPEPGKRNLIRKDLNIIRKEVEIFHDYQSFRPTDEFFTSHVDEAIDRANNQYKDKKVLRFQLLGHIGEEYLLPYLQKHFQSSQDVNQFPIFGKVFHLFFRPNPHLDKSLQDVKKKLNLIPGRYSAAHCRVRHPHGTPYGKNLKSKHDNKTADNGGLAWHDNEEGRSYALSDAVRALSCISNREEPVYFFADSSDLVYFVGRNESYIAETEREIRFRRFFDLFSISTRDMTFENSHIDLQKGWDPPGYFGTFIDLFIAMEAKCIIYGIGKYAYFASKLSDTSCRYSYRVGYSKRHFKSSVEVCDNESIPRELSSWLTPSSSELA